MIFLKKSNLTYLPPPPPGMFIAIRPRVFLYQFKHVVDCGITDSSAHGCLTPIHQAHVPSIMLVALNKAIEDRGLACGMLHNISTHFCPFSGGGDIY